MINQLLKSVLGAHYQHVQALFTTAATTHTDPVCGMSVGEPPPGGTSDYQGTTYYFCSTGCKSRFDRNPASYVPAK